MNKKIIFLLMFSLLFAGLVFAGDRGSDSKLISVDVYKNTVATDDDYYFVFTISARLTGGESSETSFLNIGNTADDGLWEQAEKIMRDNAKNENSIENSVLTYKTNLGNLTFTVVDPDSGGKNLDVLLEYNGSNVDCYSIWGYASMDVTGQNFSVCEDKALPSGYAVGVAKHSAVTGYNGMETFTIVVGNKAKINPATNGLHGKNKSALSSYFASNNILLQEEKASDNPGIIGKSAGTVMGAAEKVADGAAAVKNSVVNAYYDFKYGPTNFLWESPERKDVLVLSWKNVDKSEIQGYVIKRTAISKIPQEIKYYAVSATTDHFIFAKGDFEEDVQYDFSIYSSLQPLPPAFDPGDVVTQFELKEGKPRIRVEVTSLLNDQLLENINLVVIAKNQTYKPDSNTREIYVPHEEALVKLTNPVSKIQTYVGLEDCRQNAFADFEESAEDSIQIELKNIIPEGITIYACQDKASYVNTANAGILLSRNMPDTTIFSESDPSPEFASVTIKFKPPISYKTPVLVEQDKLLKIELENINPLKNIFFSTSKTCEQIKTEIETEAKKKIDAKRIEIKDDRTKWEKTYDVLASGANSMGSFLDSTLDWFSSGAKALSEDAETNTIAEIVGSRAGKTGAFVVVNAESFWEGIKEVYNATLDSYAEAKKAIKEGYTNAKIDVPDDAIPMPFDISTTKVYTLSPKAFEGRSSLYIGKIDGTEVKELNSSEKIPGIYVCQFDVGSIFIIESLLIAQSSAFASIETDPGSSEPCAPKIESLKIKKDNSWDEYLTNPPKDRWVNTFDYIPNDEVSVNFKSNQGLCSIYQWTLELWRKKPSATQYCDTTGRDCIRIQLESGGMIDSENKKTEDASKAVSHKQPITSAFTFKADEKVLYQGKEMTLKEAVEGVETVWLRVETCDKKTGDECKGKWLDSIAYEISIGKPESKPVPPAETSKGCKTVAECKAILDLKFINQVFGKN
ncbi:MAG: hypothetical protein NUV57_02040 [archaeon]|nr:hypothetical protein [archaeon]